MTITDLRIYPVPDARPMVAYVSLVLDEQLAIHDIRLLSTFSGYQLAMPSKRRSVHCACCGRCDVTDAWCRKCGGPLVPIELTAENRKLVYADIVHPTSPEFRAQLTMAVVAGYRQLLEQELKYDAGNPPVAGRGEDHDRDTRERRVGAPLPAAPAAGE